jgi:hypothetical protein
MRPADNIEKTIKNLKINTNLSTDESVLNDLYARLDKTNYKRSQARSPSVWRIIMESKMTKLAAVAIIIVSVTAIFFFNEITPKAYGGIEQTIKAYKNMRSIHLHHASPPAAEPQDMWIEFDEKGKVTRIRLEEGLNDTFRIMTWTDGVIKYYRPADEEFVVIDEPAVGMEIESMIEMVNPRLVAQDIYDKQLEGKFDVKIEPDATEDGLVQITATDTTPLDEPPERAFRVRYVLLVDPNTKLATQREEYQFKDGKYILQSRFFYDGFNEPVDEKMFVLEAPEHLEIDDRAARAGLFQGDLTDTEIAAELVRQHIQAMIDKDYAKAGILYNGTPEAEVRQRAEKTKVKYIRLIDIGEPVKFPKKGPRAYGVPFAFLIETADGKKEIAGPWGGKTYSPEAEANLDISKCRRAIVRPLITDPNYWVIDGGI